MRPNEHEIDKVEDMAKKIGVDRLRVKTISVNERSSFYHDLIPLNKKYHRKRKKIVNKDDCVFLSLGIPNVLWNGDVIPCCMDYFYNYIMGNAIEESIIDIWNNQEYKKFRNDYKKGTNLLCNEKCRFTKKSKIYIKDIKFH